MQSKCGGNHCQTKEVSMSGAGLSKMFDIQHNHFLFVSCTNCGYVEVFNPDILEGKKRGDLARSWMCSSVDITLKFFNMTKYQKVQTSHREFK